jgi:hypothetical protein
MPPVSAKFSVAAPRAASTRVRWLVAIVMFAIGIVPAAAMANAVGPGGTACPGATYSVVSGDSWSRIASRQHVLMTSLMNANGATTATVIHPGQTLCLPGAAAPAPTAPTPPPPATTVPAAPVGVALDVFPVQGPCSFGDTYGAPRSGGRSHEGVDIIAKAGQFVYAVKDGVLTKKYVDAPGSLSGNGWRLTIGGGTYFFYAHLSAFAPGLAVGTPVKAGQILGQVGMTGDAPIPHTHFEVHPSGGSSVNPTPIVRAVDGCKNTAVPAQPNGVQPPTTPTAPTAPIPPPATTPAPPTIPTTAPATTTTTIAPYAHRRDLSDVTGASRPRRVASTA